MRAAGFDADLLADLPELTRAAHAMTRSPQDVDDLVQETVVKAMRFADRFDGPDIHGWLFTVMWNVYRSQRRRAWRTVEDPDGTRAMRNEIEPSQIRHIELRETLAAIETLPSAFRDVMRLVAAGMDQQEIAEALGVPHATVRTRIWKARRLLADGAYK